ncbi:laminin alpha 5 chain [Salpingoeca rosetta]|uniref:Laminin alpha 5 chain n=1 Tax=Salpingoeca rosetta (strain ATCC 50818 / BSB-021) TaxID=946362 RepID=F2U6Q9_SALR5|nr:laminin alpha 5 chain [Salpingoeca rosetta]EGD83541.1 laminin alpha 5 chain [Salpingoeca rosetta]|eukprot:XP_004995045.1 laminin alpha 5 chain [Salpingoeca rosetta]
MSCVNVELDGTCVPNCPTATFVDDQRRCIACDSQCDSRGCVGPSASECRACRRFSLNGTCMNDCPAGTTSVAGGDCQPCHHQCADGCTGVTAFDCVACRTFSRVLNTGAVECIDACDTFEYSTADSVCAPCHAECQLGCTGPSASECLDNACRRFSLQDGECVATCPSNTYADDEGVCRPCSSLCNGACWGPGDHQCLSCADSAVAIVQAQAGVVHVTCADTCPDGTYEDDTRVCRTCDAACATCSGPSSTSCGSCVAFADTTTSTCVSSCPHDAYASPTAPVGFGTTAPEYCMPCNAMCDGCFGPSNADCAACRGVVADGRCVSSCPNGTYLQDSTCWPCSEQCSGGCRGPGAADCISCAGVLGSDGVCRNECFAWEYADEDGICRPCHSLCSTVVQGCSGPSPDDCTECAGVLVPTSALQTGQENNGSTSTSTASTGTTVTSASTTTACRAACPHGFFADADTSTCTPCHDACDGCTGPDASDCAACATARYGGVCVLECPTSTFLSTSGTCAVCNAQCSQSARCSGPTAFDCLPADGQPVMANPCANVRHEGACVSACPAGFFADNNRECAACHRSCAACSGAGEMDCTSCRRGSHLTASGECDDCNPLCRDGLCSGPTAADCDAGCLAVTDLSDPQTPVCLVACPVGTFSDTTPVDGACNLCHTQCAGGCTGVTAFDCVACANVENEGRCVSACPDGSAPSEAGVCGRCHDECIDGCERPGDASACVRCRNKEEDGACVVQCSTGFPFLAGDACLAACPGDQPFYNDTRQSATFLPARCVTSCAQLGDARRTYVSEAAPFRCTTEDQARRDTRALSSASSSGNEATTNILIVVVCVVAFLMLVVVMLFLRRARQTSHTGDAAISSPVTLTSRTDSKSSFGAAQPGAHQWNPQWAAENDMLRQAPLVVPGNGGGGDDDDDGGYLTVEPIPQPTHSTHV